MAKSRAAGQRPNRQDEQHRLFEEAKRRPGVAAAIEAYGALAPYGGRVGSELPTIRFATGGNYPAERTD